MALHYSTESLQCKTYRFAIGPFHHKLVLKHDEVPFSRLETHHFLKLGAESVQEISAGDCGFLRGKNTHPAQARDDALALGLAGKSAYLLDASND